MDLPPPFDPEAFAREAARVIIRAIRGLGPKDDFLDVVRQELARSEVELRAGSTGGMPDGPVWLLTVRSRGVYWTLQARARREAGSGPLDLDPSFARDIARRVLERLAEPAA